MTQASKKQGFTLIEMLVVIGIILVLVSIAVVAYNRLDGAAGVKATRLLMQDLKGMLAEYEIAGGDVLALSGGTANPVRSPGDMNPGPDSDGDSITNCYDAQDTNLPALSQTRNAINLLVAHPANMTGYNSLPQRSRIKIPDSLMNNAGLRPQLFTNAVVDTWGTAIIYVPSGGLSEVNTAGGGNLTIRSPDNRPFFASAGPDGHFGAGDDNVYSFD